MDKHKLGLFTLLLLLGLSLDARCQQAYVTGGAGASNWSLDCGSSGCSRNPTSWRVAAGYRLNHVVAFEGFYIDLGRARSSDFSTDGSLASTGLGVQTLLGWDFGTVELAGKIGWARMRNRFQAAPTSPYESLSRNRNEVIGGLMAAWHVAPNLSIRFDADIVTVALDGDFVYYARGADVTTYMLGVMLRF
jgi:hypothetical protein